MKTLLIASALALVLSGCVILPEAISTYADAKSRYCTNMTPEARAALREKLQGDDALKYRYCPGDK